MDGQYSCVVHSESETLGVVWWHALGDSIVREEGAREIKTERRAEERGRWRWREMRRKTDYSGRSLNVLRGLRCTGEMSV